MAKASKLFETRNFGLLIGVGTVLVMLLITFGTVLINDIELRVLDFNFRLKGTSRQQTIQEGVVETQRNPNISDDILIVSIDDRALDRFGKWPFPRYIHGDLMNSFARIQEQNKRERALFIDVFFIEPDAAAAEDDAILVDAIEENGRVFLETVMTRNESPPGSEAEFFERHEELYAKYGSVDNIQGDWRNVNIFFGTLPPLQPYARANQGYGHANFIQDPDEVFRRQPLVARIAQELEEIPIDELTVDHPVDVENFEHLTWQDTRGQIHEVELPLTERVIQDLRRQLERSAPLKAVDTDNDRTPDLFYHVVRKYEDRFIPSITLSLAAQYFNKGLADLEVVVGEHIRIVDPQRFDIDSGTWQPYRIETRPATLAEDGSVVQEAEYREIPEILIPIDDKGQMLVNFMGIGSSPSPQGHQTFPVRSYSGYAANPGGIDPSRWPRNRAVANKIVMVGPFAKGIAEDEKPTPFGLMYGVEIHANALNTILMDKFLTYAPQWMSIAIMAAIVMLTALMVSHLSTLWSFLLTFVLDVAYFFVVVLVFDSDYILPLTAPVIGSLLAFVAIVAYRVVTEEKDKRHIRDMFGKYVSPHVVTDLLTNPPELGGVDKELSVFFSDIRGFTTLSESMTPQELVNHLNIYLGKMTDIILEYQGTLDKYVGDEIMCFWGAPLPQTDHAMLACKCALKQMDTLRALNEEWPEERRINIGIGVNSGIMTVGNMGSEGRMNYTLMGDNVNLGARLEGTNKQYITNVIISEFTYGLVKDRVIVRELDNIRVKGKNKPVLIYELVDIAESETMEPPAAIESNGAAAKAPAPEHAA